MKPVVAILLLALLLPGTGRARTTLVAPPNGGLEFVAASSEMLLCEMHATGTQWSKLICFELKDGSVRWRRQVEAPTVACVIENGMIYRIARDNHLGGYESKGGKQAWEVRVQVPAPQTPHQSLRNPDVEAAKRQELERYSAFLKDELENFDNYYPKELRSVGTNLFVQLSPGFWATFRAEDGGFVEYGPGHILGLAGNTAYVSGPHPQLIKNGRTDQSSVWLNLGSIRFGMVSPAAREDRMLLTDPTGSIEFLQTADVQGNISERWKFPLVANEISDAAVAGDYVVRFEQGSQVDDGKTNRNLFVELYDRAGKQVKATRFAAEGTNGTAKRYFFGKTGRGDIVFQQGRELQVVSVPSLKVVNRLQFSQTAEGTGPHGQPLMSTLHWMPGSDAVCEVSPTRFLAYYAEEGATRPVSVRLVDYYSGKTVWSHEETVTIETYSNWKKPAAK